MTSSWAKIDWPTKRLRITDRDKEVFLQGTGAASIICNFISVERLKGIERKGEIEQILVIRSTASTSDNAGSDSDLPPELQSLLCLYEDVFAEPNGLPSVQACDHQIPLIAGAQPVQVRPYRHTPALKDEIERQVA